MATYKGSQPFHEASTVLLTTFRRDGTPVATPVSIAVSGDRSFVRTYESSGKCKRLRNDTRVEVAPSTFRGRAVGPAAELSAHVLHGADADMARRLIEASHPWLHGRLVPLIHRLTGKRTCYLELTPRRNS